MAKAKFRAIIANSSKPNLKRFTVMRQDKVRGNWVLLSPERITVLDDVGRAILGECDGVKTVDEIARILADTWAAPADVIVGDMKEFLQVLSDQLLLEP